MKILNSASLVGFSGGLRLYLAFILADVEPNLPLVIASSLIIYAIYTIDRSLDNKEDEINHQEFAGANKIVGLVVSGIAIIVGISIFFSKSLFSPPLFPFAVGILYSCGIPFKGKQLKLKGGFGIKNIVIGITWGGTIGLVIASTGQLVAAMAIGIYFGIKLFINSTIFDLKDVKGDLAAGIQTLPVVLGELKLKHLLFSVCIIQHLALAMAMMENILIRYEIFFMYSFIASSLVIIYYTPAYVSSESWMQKKFRILAINGEPIILVIFSMFHHC
jgi:4-hydroxybenzoate polyprenyltransferase